MENEEPENKEADKNHLTVDFNTQATRRRSKTDIPKLTVLKASEENNSQSSENQGDNADDDQPIISKKSLALSPQMQSNLKQVIKHIHRKRSTAKS